MNPRDLGVAGGLAGLGVIIWIRDLSWWPMAGDALPILAGFGLFAWLGAPWRFKMAEGPAPRIAARPLLICAGLFCAGAAANSTLLLALSWCGLLWAWLKLRLPEERHPLMKQLLVLPLLSFPWILLDGQPVGWAFRLSGAWATEHVFHLFHQNALREGTQLWLNGQPVAVEAACSGLNSLQSLLLAGTALAIIFLGPGRRFWWNLPLLAALAWLANTVRIVSLCLAAVFISPEFFRGALHQGSGWLLLMVMFSLCWVWFSWQRPPPVLADVSMAQAPEQT